MTLNSPQLNELEDILCPVINIVLAPAPLPDSLCPPCDVQLPNQPTEIEITDIEVCLKSFIHNQVHSKYCMIPPKGCGG